MFTIPIEHLGPRGMTRELAGAVCEARGVSTDWVAIFNEAFRRYWSRAEALFKKAPSTWFPPRTQHVCVAKDVLGAPPYTQPFEQSSWLLYEADFDGATSSIELATYLFFHTERYGIAKNVMAASIHNLAYFLARSDEQIADFVAGAKRSTRPDAEVLRAVADATAWQLYHSDIKPPPDTKVAQLGKLEAADLFVPMELQTPMKQLAATTKRVGEDVVRDYDDRIAGQGNGADLLCTWLEDEVPRVLVVGQGGRTLWDPDAPDTSSLRSVVTRIQRTPAESVRDDLAVIGKHTSDFLAKLRDPSALPKPHDLDQDAGAYIHQERQLIAYDIEHPRMKRLSTPAAPYQRLMLGARTIHEWGHLAVDGGLVAVPDGKLSGFNDAQQRAAGIIDQALDAAPDDLSALAEGHRGEHFVGVIMQRMDDFQANMLARTLLSEGEMETYVRANVVSLFQEMAASPWIKLARHAYEFQYLRLSKMPDPMAYFIGSTWFRHHFVEAQIVSQEGTSALFDAVKDICDCYAIDDAAFV